MIQTPNITGTGNSDPSGRTQLIFGNGTPNSTIYAYYNGEPNTVIAQVVVEPAGNFMISVPLKYQDEGRATVISMHAVFGLERSGWAPDTNLYPKRWPT